MLFLIVGGLGGLLLGLRFKILALVPVILILACAAIVTGDNWKAIALTVAATAVLAQVGYLLGLACRLCVGGYVRRRKATRHRPSKPKSVSF
jgi:hypothetical protein